MQFSPTVRVLAALFTVFTLSLAAGAALAEQDDHPALIEHLGLMESGVSLPGVSGSALAGLVNPGAWAMQYRGGFYMGYEELAGDPYADMDYSNLTAVMNGGSMGFGLQFNSLGDDDHYEYTLGFAGGDRSHSSGLSYTWTRGAEGTFGAKNELRAGSVHHWRKFSVASSVAYEFDLENTIVQADIGVRPIGPRLTLFGGASYLHNESLFIDPDDEDLGEYDNLAFSYGIEAKVLPGLNIAAMGRDSGEISLRFDLAWGANKAGTPPMRSVLGARVHMDDEQEHAATTYVLESNVGPHLGMLFAKPTQYPELHLKGGLSYRNFKYFDDRRRFLGLLNQIADQGTDPNVGGVVLNLSGFGTSPANLWELRAQLAGMRAEGKKVIVYIDRMGLPLYMMASVADEIWMDPLGSVDIAGLAFGRSYYKRLLDKMGVGIDEWRFFTYKSAMEGFSRTSMSDADREQYTAFMNDWYEEGVGLILEARGISREKWDELVNTKADLLPEEALEAGLIDKVGDFHEVTEAAKEIEARETGDSVSSDLAGLYGDRVWSDEEWGEPAKIAMLYAIGGCSMDTGIKGRQLSKTIREIRDNDAVKAVVMRADSPGGDPLPSDLVSRELKETMESKPVYISQGQVAASGGYWISMHSHAIHASPFTITGSIGVISAHIWDDGLGDKIGMDYDHVQIGDHADVGRGPALPLLGMTIPHRPVTEEERARAEFVIRDLYTDFTKEVAEGRGMTPEEIDKIAQGRVWSGTAGLEIGLIDEIGGLWGSLLAAKKAAGIPADRAVQLIEAPGLGSFNFAMFQPKLFGIELPWFGGADEAVPAAASLLSGQPWSHLSAQEREYLEQVIGAEGAPMVVMPPFAVEGAQLHP